MTDIAAHFACVEKSFPGPKGAVAAISGFDLTLETGEFYCLLGPSGCGKTTALRLLAGFELPTSGEVIHRGRPVGGPGADRGVVFQGDDSLMPWLTARENVMLGPRIQGYNQAEQGTRADKLLELVGLAGHGHKYPREMSGGMKQRIQIARVLVNDPDTLLMDEPFGALDAQTRSYMQDELTRIWSVMRKTVLFITHDVQEALVLGDRIGVMRAGPGSAIAETFFVDLPRPRHRTDARLVSYYGDIEATLAREGNRERNA